MKRLLLNSAVLISFICFVTNIAMAQSSDADKPSALCGFDEYAKEMEADPVFRKNLQAFEDLWKKKQTEMLRTANKVVINGTDTIYEIPLVFHIIHSGQQIGAGFNPSVIKINNVINYLNQTYAASWPAYPLAAQEGVNIPIRFVLAKRNPLCEASDGINRINVHDVLSPALAAEYTLNGVHRSSSFNGGIQDSVLKDLVQWDPALYYNIWVVSKIDGWSGYTFGGGVVGYARFPGGDPRFDGTVIMEAFNAAGQTTLPHELGHAFSLYHTFQGGCQTIDCLGTGDKVCDTDPHDVNYYCPTGNNPCTGTSWIPVVYNLMGYSNCTNRFTEGQKERVKLALLTQRSRLLTSLGSTAIGQEVTYVLPVTLNCLVPTLPIVNQNNSYNMGPADIKIGDLDYHSQGYTFDGKEYIDHTLVSCLEEQLAPINMTKGDIYPVEISTYLNQQNVRVWIDFNNNGSFDASELVFSSNAPIANDYIHIGNTIAIPNTAVTDVNLRMRVLADGASVPNPDACGDNLAYGQIEDFMVNISAPLPVNLKEISAQPSSNQKSIEVIWTTSSERDVAYYEIQRSTDGKSFEKIGELRAKNEPSKYVFNDVKPIFNQQNYYRLRIVDRDESSAFSKVVSASIDRIVAAVMEVYPNPANDFINVVLNTSGSYLLTITNTLGQLIYSNHDLNFEKSIPHLIDLKSNKLTPGLYYLNLKDQFGKKLKSKFVIGKF